MTNKAIKKLKILAKYGGNIKEINKAFDTDTLSSYKKKMNNIHKEEFNNFCESFSKKSFVHKYFIENDISNSKILDIYDLVDKYYDYEYFSENIGTNFICQRTLGNQNKFIEGIMIKQQSIGSIYSVTITTNTEIDIDVFEDKIYSNGKQNSITIHYKGKLPSSDILKKDILSTTLRDKNIIQSYKLEDNILNCTLNFLNNFSELHDLVAAEKVGTYTKINR